MKKYNGCPREYSVVEEHPLYIEISRPNVSGTGGIDTLRIPAQFWPRFIIDNEWRNVLFSKYAKRIYTKDFPKKDFVFNGKILNVDNSQELLAGIIPEDEVFAITKFPNCPNGFGKVEESDQRIILDHYYLDGSDGGSIEVPAILWDKFVQDQRWREKVVSKYTRLKELDYRTEEEILKRFSKEELYKTGVIPESEL